MMPCTSQAAQSPAGFADAATEVAEVISALAPARVSRLMLLALEQLIDGAITLVEAVEAFAAGEPVAHIPTATMSAAATTATMVHFLDRR
jgi:hypothetical protein